MILTFHNIGNEINNITITLKQFTSIINSLKDKQIVYLDDYNVNNSNHVVITFDDGYKSILNTLPILSKNNYPFELFIVGDFYNEGENGNLNFLNKKDLQKLIKSGGRLQYHTKSHPNLENIDSSELLEHEIQTPQDMKLLDPKGFKWLAYPYCSFNDKVIEITKKYYKGARAGKKYGNDNPYSLNSLLVTAKSVVPQTL